MSPTERPLDGAEAKRLGQARGTLFLDGMGRALSLSPSFRGSMQMTLYLGVAILAQITVGKDSRPQVFRGYVLSQGTSIHLAPGEAALVEAYLAALYGDAS